MKKILPYQLFEAIYIGKIGLEDYRFVYTPATSTGLFYLNFDNGENYEVEVKSNGKPEKGGFYNTFRIFSPSNPHFDINQLVDKMIYILNKNRLGYKFTVSNIVTPKYGLQPYGIIEIDKPIKMSDLEQLVASTKSTNKYVKKGGDFDQFTF